MATDAFYMKKALEEARRAYEEDEIPVGAVVVCGDRILARAHNLTETLTDVTAHAEMQALKLSTARVVLNQVDTLSDPTMADRFEAALDHPLVATSLK